MRVAILGAGACGLAAIKCCLDENLEPVCFERTDHIGGLWHYTNDVTSGQGSVAKTTIVNTSKEMMCYSDFPIPREFPNFMHHTRLVEYFQMYAGNFKLERHIRFHTEVMKVSRAEDFAETGRWTLTIRDRSQGRVWDEVFDAVMLCTGHLAREHVPRFEGDDVYEGRLMHAVQFRDHVGFEDKTVIVIGLGTSAGDAAVDLSRVAKQVYLSTRRGGWVAKRLSPGGMPFDMNSLRRSNFALLSLLPDSWKSSIVEFVLNRQMDHATFNLKPNHRYFQAGAMFCDELANRIASGTVVVKPDVKRFRKGGVDFVDGSKVDGVDVVILATGYIFGFPYLDEGIIDVKDNHVDLYMYMFPPEMEHTTLAAIGFVQQQGALNPVAEMQCRWAARVFKKVARLPPREQMWADIRQKKEAMAKRYIPSLRHTIQVDVIPYMDELAELIGCKPAIGRMLMKEPRLACSVFFGPCTPYQYRLEGPGQWRGAKQAIATQWDRTLHPLAPSAMRTSKRKFASCWKCLFFVMVLSAVLSWIIL